MLKLYTYEKLRGFLNNIEKYKKINVFYISVTQDLSLVSIFHSYICFSWNIFVHILKKIDSQNISIRLTISIEIQYSFLFCDIKNC